MSKNWLKKQKEIKKKKKKKESTEFNYDEEDNDEGEEDDIIFKSIPSIISSDLQTLKRTIITPSLQKSNFTNQKRRVESKSFKICFLIGFAGSERILSCISQIKYLILAIQKGIEKKWLNRFQIKISFVLYRTKDLDYNERFKVFRFTNNYTLLVKRIKKVKKELSKQIMNFESSSSLSSLSSDFEETFKKEINVEENEKKKINQMITKDKEEEEEEEDEDEDNESDEEYDEEEGYDEEDNSEDKKSKSKMKSKSKSKRKRKRKQKQKQKDKDKVSTKEGRRMKKKKKKLDFVEVLEIISSFDWKSDNRIVVHVSEKINSKLTQNKKKLEMIEESLNESILSLVLKQVEYYKIVFSKIQIKSVLLNLYKIFNHHLRNEKKEFPEIKSNLKFIRIKKQNFSRVLNKIVKKQGLIWKKNKIVKEFKIIDPNDDFNMGDLDNQDLDEQLEKKKKKQKKDITDWTEFLETKVYYIDENKTDLEGLIAGTSKPHYKVINKKFSICKKWFDQGTFRRVHRMIDEDNNKFVAKIFRRHTEEKYLEKKYHDELITQFVAKQFAKKFNSKKPFRTIDFLQGFYCKFPINSNQRKRQSNNNTNDDDDDDSDDYGDNGDDDNQENEIFICNGEPFLKGRYVKYCNNYEMKLKYDKYTTIYSFPHFTFEKSGRKLMVVDLQGVGRFFTDPAIHSIGRIKRFNSADLGEFGIKAFFENHICSLGCKKLNLTKMNKKIKKIKTINWETSGFLPYEILCSNIFCPNKIIIPNDKYNYNEKYFCEKCALKFQFNSMENDNIDENESSIINRFDENNIENNEYKDYQVIKKITQFDVYKKGPQRISLDKLKNNIIVDQDVIEIEYLEDLTEKGVEGEDGTNGVNEERGGNKERVENKEKEEAIIIHSVRPIPSEFTQYYFEVTILNLPSNKDMNISIGLVRYLDNLTGVIGEIENSFGYHSSTGNFFHSNTNGLNFGPTYTKGDTIGVCLDRKKRFVYYTKNQENLGIALRESPLLDKPVYPAISISQPNVKIKINFGKDDFLFNPYNLSKIRTLVSIRCDKCNALKIPICPNHGLLSVIFKNINKNQNTNNNSLEKASSSNNNNNSSSSSRSSSNKNNKNTEKENVDLNTENISHQKYTIRCFYCPRKTIFDEKKIICSDSSCKTILSEKDLIILNFSKKQIQLALKYFPKNKSQINHIILQCPTCKSTIFTHDQFNNLTKDVNGDIVTINDEVLEPNQFFNSSSWIHSSNTCNLFNSGLIKIKIRLSLKNLQLINNKIWSCPKKVINNTDN
ncbi:eukaryotic elongation factor 2 kinase-related [Anaeramoeba flamelloides]|uniref:Eukaryotic elongation factor 2 kinase-related n=1 Tax=Anaeramoeba flamelloides TaxID=1746091 RepID=A0AAV7YTT3_9EUKA|nr:eukaryotic elongation factor 2 kinase-related [Anaeramoeba flamelloides]